MEKLKSISVLVLVFVLVVFANPVIAGTIEVNVNGLDEITADIDSDGYIEFTGGVVHYLSDPGEPALPYRLIKVLLPPETDLSTVAVSLKNVQETTLFTGIEVKPVEPPVTWSETGPIQAWPDDVEIENGRNLAVYGKDEILPGNKTGRLMTGQIREWKVVEVPVCVFRYNPVQGLLSKISTADIQVTYESFPLPLSSSAIEIGGDSIAAEMARDSVVNFEKAGDFYGFSTTLAPQDLNAQAEGGYAVITTSSIIENSSELDNFVSWKRSLGYTVYLLDENNWGGGRGNAAAENIRDWLKNNYLSHNIKYALLIGNPHPDSGNVPMKMLWPRKNATGEYTQNDYRQSPSDLYYADLNGNWDFDGDGFYGEGDDDMPSSGGIDFNWDVYVGRIPFYGSYQELDRILVKTISYENVTVESSEWRKNVLLPMKPSDEDTPGYHLGEAVKDDVLPYGWGYERIYEENYGIFPAPEKTPCNVGNVTSSWTGSNFGAVIWWTHGSPTSATDIMNTSNVSRLDDNHPSIVFQVSCLNAYPENSGNLSYSLLKNGAVAAIGASRISWYSPGQKTFANSPSNSGLAFDFSRQLIAEGKTIGESLFRIKNNRCSNAAWWMNFTDFNLYGDPSLYIVSGYELDQYSVEGKVRDEEGKPVPDVSVTVEGDYARRMVSTNYRGLFSAEVPSGDYDIKVDKKDWVFDPDNVDVSVNGGDLDVQDFVAKPSKLTTTTDTTSSGGGGGGGGCNLGNLPLSWLLLLMPLFLLSVRKRNLSQQ